MGLFDFARDALSTAGEKYEKYVEKNLNEESEKWLKLISDEQVHCSTIARSVPFFVFHLGDVDIIFDHITNMGFWNRDDKHNPQKIRFTHTDTSERIFRERFKDFVNLQESKRMINFYHKELNNNYRNHGITCRCGGLALPVQGTARIYRCEKEECSAQFSNVRHPF